MRTWSSLDVVKPLAGKRSAGGSHQLKLVDGNLVVEEDQPFVPRGIWAVVDGMQWAWILIGVETGPDSKR